MESRKRALIPRLTVVALTCCGIASVTDAVAQSPFSYFRVDASVTPSSFGDANWFDLELDGDQDLLFVTSSGAGARVPATRIYEQIKTTVRYTQEGAVRASGEYVERGIANAPDIWLADIDWADFDLDGDLDAVVSGTQQTEANFVPEVHLLENTGSGVLQRTSLPGVVPVLGTVRWADVDNDGDSDLLTIGTSAAGEPSTTLYRNSGGTFLPTDFVLPPLSLGDAAWADIDLDGDTDVALCGFGADGALTSAIFRNESGNGFSRLDLDLVGLGHCSLDWGDYDNDAFPDLLVSGGRGSHLVLGGMTRVYRGIGGTFFQEQPFQFRGAVAGSAAWIDVDSDGALHVVENGGTDLVFGRASTRVYRNETDGFRHVSNITGTFPGSMDAGDFDGDGDLDLVMVGLDRDGVALTSIFLNGELLANSPPASPVGLQATVSGGQVAFSWSQSVDETTHSNGLTYNLRVGTEPGRGDIMSVPVDGQDRPARSMRGNVGWNTAWTLRDLENGVYYWSVQAVDNSLATSRFSTTESFEVTASSGTKPVSVDEDPATPSKLYLRPPFPNPAYASSRFELGLPRSATVRVDVFDGLGRKVATLVDGTLTAGMHVISWDGMSANAESAAPGMYLVRLSAHGESRTTTVALVR